MKLRHDAQVTWHPDVKLWRFVIRRTVRWTPSADFIEYVFGVEDEPVARQPELPLD